MTIRCALFCLLLSAGFRPALAEKNLVEQTQPIVAEGKMLYRSEMASWYGTDLFLANHPDRSTIGGYFSYPEGEKAKCIFFSKGESPKVIGTISFDSTYNPQAAELSLDERQFTENERDLYEIRKSGLKEINSDMMFMLYENTNFNLIPIINGTEKKVYVLTGSQKNGVVIFGNDYLLTFNKNNKLTGKKKLHQNILPTDFSEQKDGDNLIVGGIHNHADESGYFMTATDICTIMLYQRLTNWTTYTVVSRKYINIWNCSDNSLLVVRNDEAEQMLKHQEEIKSR